MIFDRVHNTRLLPPVRLVAKDCFQGRLETVHGDQTAEAGFRRVRARRAV